MKKLGCAKCGGSMKKMQKGGSMKTTVATPNTPPQMYGIPQTGTTNYSAPTMKKGGVVKKKYQKGGPTKTSVNNGAYGKSVSVENTKTGSKTLVDKGFSVDGRSNVTKYKDVTHVGKDGKTYKTSVAKSDTGKKITNETPKMKFSATSGVNGKSALTTSKKTGASTFVTTDKKTGDKKVLVTTKDGKSYSKNVKMAKGGSTGFGMLSVKAGVDNNPRVTAADRIAGAKKKAKFGASVPVQHSPAPGRVRSSSGVGTVPVGTRKKMGGSIKKKK